MSISEGEPLIDPVPSIDWEEDLSEDEARDARVVFQITTVERLGELVETPGGGVRRDIPLNEANLRTPVLADSFEMAHRILQENRDDIHETTYQYAVVERVVVNRMYPVSFVRAWYAWDVARRAYRFIPEPKGLDHLVSFGGVG